MPASRREPDTGAAPDRMTPTLKVAVVARRLGVAPATLRTWARRYGLGPGAHSAGEHRQYSTDDMTRLVVMRRLTLEGVAPAEAARIAVATPVGADAGVGSAGAVSPDGERPPGGSVDLPPVADFGRAGGGRVVALPSAGPAVRGLARAAMSLDPYACRHIIETAIRRDGVVSAWEELARPVLVALGQRWEAGGGDIDVEHLLSESVLRALRVVGDDERPRSAGAALLACAEDEQHSLPLHILGAALEERGVTVRLLGARVPRQALAEAVRRSGPAVVVVHATISVPDGGGLDELPRLRPAPRVFVAGTGWAGVRLPVGATRLLSLAQSVDEVTGAVCG